MAESGGDHVLSGLMAVEASRAMSEASKEIAAEGVVKVAAGATQMPSDNGTYLQFCDAMILALFPGMTP